ncbi:cell division septal protein FtsQ [Rhodoligotrophos appendicifer]|uniref:cell division protein FtsQ/DivIB n=1 Tax=Rhodoligotrophos appendicifer TaxID=987056 RepID=UPI00118715B4|nr:FtsQ-type POTRA domain-containing protein [Rhodoligotrophos appendicifer]
MRQVSASDWIKRSVENPGRDDLRLASSAPTPHMLPEKPRAKPVPDAPLPEAIRPDLQRAAPAAARPRPKLEPEMEAGPAPIEFKADQPQPRKLQPQFQPLPLQLPSREEVAKVTRARNRHDRRPRPRGTFLADTVAVVFLAAALLFALIQGGSFEERGGSLRALVNEASALVGFSAENIAISGLQHQSREAVLSAIGVEEGGSLIGFDAIAARDKLKSLDWVSHASVLRLFPNRLQIELDERVPFALWQSDGVFKVIDKDGVAMPSLSVKAYKTLPIVVGEGANLAAVDLVNHLEAQPEIMSMTRAAVRVADRRWVLYLSNTIKVDLPEEKVPQALALLVTLTDRYGIMTRDITNIDMRLSDRVVVRLSDEAAGKLQAEKSKKPIKVSRNN